MGHFQMVTSSAINLEFSVEKIVKMKGVVNFCRFHEVLIQMAYKQGFILSELSLVFVVPKLIDRNCPLTSPFVLSLLSSVSG